MCFFYLFITVIELETQNNFYFDSNSLLFKKTKLTNLLIAESY